MDIISQGEVVRKAITPFISPEVGAMGNFEKWPEPNPVCRYVLATYLGRQVKYLCLSRPKVNYIGTDSIC